MSSRWTKRHKEKQSTKLPIKLNHIRKRNFTMHAYIDVSGYGWCMLDLDCCIVEEDDLSYNIIIYLYIYI